MKTYRDPDTGRFISRKQWEEMQREKQREEEADDFDGFDDFGDSPEGEEYGEEF